MTSLNKEQITREIGRFADLDSPVQVTTSGGDLVISFRQRSENVRLTIDILGGRVNELRDEQETRYGSYRDMLGSAQFGDLRRLVAAQKAMLTREAPYILQPQKHLPIVGELLNSEGEAQSGSLPLLEAVDNWLSRPAQRGDPVRALVIDGPAGIGKTHLLRRLVLERITGFTAGSAPPILHILSQGRKLTTLNDLIAGRLQALRLTLTFDQVPVLARYGLIQIALDGFDELADPNGYENAWISLRDFVEEIGTSGAIVLAGRDTFIDANVVRQALPRLDTPNTFSVHLRLLSANEARKWLLTEGLTEDQLQALRNSGLLDRGSYALRPFFVSQIAEIGRDSETFDDFYESPLRSLIQAIIDREVTILRQDESLRHNALLCELLSTFYCEVAREMADAESDSIDEGGIALIVELVFGGHIPAPAISMLQNRAKALVLLEQDAKQDRRRFPHTEIQDFFLAQSYIRTVKDGELPKSLRRNILGADFLETFHDVTQSEDAELIRGFLDAGRKLLKSGLHADRSRKNLPALMLAAQSERFHAEHLVFDGLSLDEIVLRGTSAPAQFNTCDISRLDIRGADIASLKWSNCSIITLTADLASRVGPHFPNPNTLALDDNGKLRTFRQSLDIIGRIRSMTVDLSNQELPLSMLSGAHLKLFDKVCRIIVRQHWIRLVGGDRAGELLETDEWQRIRPILNERGLLSIREAVDARGPRSDFVRVNRADEFLTLGRHAKEIEDTLACIRELDSS